MKRTDAETTAFLAEFLGLPPDYKSAVLCLEPGRAAKLEITYVVKKPIGEIGQKEKTIHYAWMPTGESFNSVDSKGREVYTIKSRTDAPALVNSIFVNVEGERGSSRDAVMQIGHTIAKASARNS